MSRAVAVVKPLCGLARVVSENRACDYEGPLRWTVARGRDIQHREVVIYVYTAMVSSVWDVSTHAITARVQGITYLQNHRSERPISYPIKSHLQRPRARAHAQLNLELFIFEQSPRLYQSFLSAPFLSGARAGAAGMSGTKKVWPG